MSQANLYISKRCPYCRKLLEVLHGRNDLRGMITITCIDEQPFPKYIKKVPTMVVGNELWDNQKILSTLNESQKTSNQTKSSNEQCNVNNNNNDDELMGYCDNGQCYYGIDEQPMDTYFEEINDDISESKVRLLDLRDRSHNG